MKEIVNDCRNCRFFDQGAMECSIKEGSPIRKCIIGLNRNFVEDLSSSDGGRLVLEIGCGAWSYLKEHLPLGAVWEGIDPVEIDEEGRKTIATKIGSVEAIPFEREKFDYVLANQSIEHWFEFGVTFEQALSEISRVLRPGGIFTVNFPIHLHGHKIFLLGSEDRILDLFRAGEWEVVRLERWRKEPSPLPRYQGWKEISLSDCLGREYDNRSTWIMNLILKKKSEAKLSVLDSFFGRLAKISSEIFPKKALYLLNYGPILSARIIKKRLKI